MLVEYGVRWDGYHWRVYVLWIDPITRRWRSHCLPNRYTQVWRVLKAFQRGDVIMFFLPIKGLTRG